MIKYLLNEAEWDQHEIKDQREFNPLQPSVAYLYLPKTLENLKVFWCFQGV